jgi:AcrR family transcriptional regulator
MEMSRLPLLDMVYTKKIDRETLVIVASELLEQEGLDAVSMRRLALALDVRASSLYHHFADKSALLSAVAEKGLHLLAAELEQARAWADPDAHQQIRELGMAYREWALLHPQLYLLLFGTTPVEEPSSPTGRAVAAPMVSVATQLVGEQNAVAAAQAAWAFVHGFVMLELAGQMQLGDPVEGFLLGLEVFAQGLDSNRMTRP